MFSVAKEGVLKKESPKAVLGIRAFQKRYFALEENGKASRLCYWKKDKKKPGDRPHGSIRITSIINIKPFTDSSGK